MKPGGVIRIAVPSVERIVNNFTQSYADFAFEHGYSTAPTRKAAVKAIIFNHGHLSAWSEGLLAAFLTAIGFVGVKPCSVEGSNYGLEGVNGHHRVIGKEFNDLETVVVEGVKP